jgi:hypothetical protein
LYCISPATESPLCIKITAGLKFFCASETKQESNKAVRHGRMKDIFMNKGLRVTLVMNKHAYSIKVTVMEADYFSVLNGNP